MLWSRLNNNITRKKAWVVLQDQIPAAFWMFLHLLEIAREANHKGKILEDGVPVQVADIAYLTRGREWSTETAWARFFEEAHAVGIILISDEDGDLCYQIAEWHLWHVAPSDLPDARAERVRKHRAKPLSANVTDVTNCNGCNDNRTDSTAQTEQTVQQRTDSYSTETRAREECPTDTAAAAEGWGPVVKVLLELQPGSMGSAKFRQQVAAWCSARQDRASPIDYLTAAAYAVAEVRHQWHLGKTVTNPLTYGLTIAQNHLAPATERRIGNEARAKAGLSIAPYVWEPPREQKEAS